MFDAQDPSSNWSWGQPPRSERRGGRLASLILVALLIGGLSGGGVSYAYLNWARQNSASGLGPATVNMITAGTPTGTELAARDAVGIERVAAVATPSVVEVTTESKVTHPFWGSYVTDGAGSGVILSADGYLITNNHVIEGSSSVTVRTYDGQEYSAQVIGADAQTDLAVLKINAQGLTPVVFADSDVVQVGQLAVAVGNPLGTLGGTVTEGIISAKDRAITIDGQVMSLLQTSAAINPGNSGGGLFDGNGCLVGIVSAKSSGTDIEGLGFAIPSKLVATVVTELITNGYVTGRPSFGVGVHEITRQSDLYRYRLNTPGVYVTSVESGSAFEQWDRIVSIDDRSITGVADIKQALTGYTVGSAVDVTIQRGGRTMILTIVLQEKSQSMTASETV